MDPYVTSFSVLAGCRDGAGSGAGPAHAEGQLSAFSLPLSGLCQQRIAIARLPAHLFWQRLRLAGGGRAQTPLQHLLHHAALYCSPHWHRQRRWWQLTLHHAEELARRTAPSGFQQLSLGQRKPQHLPLPGCGNGRADGFAFDHGGRRDPSADQAAGPLVVTCASQYDGGAAAL